jgi:hypothetical protein
MVIALNPLASDIFTTAISLSFCIALVVSVMVYLPRTYGPAHSTAKVMVGVSGRATSIAALSPISPSSGLPGSSASRSPFRRSATQTSMMQMPMQNQGGEAGASQFALMSLLREGGQWEGEEDILRDVHGHGPHSPLTPVSGTVSGRGDIDGAEVRRRGNGPSDKGGTDAYGQRQPKGSLGSLVRETKPTDDWSDKPTLPAAVSWKPMDSSATVTEAVC